MNRNSSTYLAYGAFTVAVCVWIVVGYFALLIQSEEQSYVQQMAAAATQADKAAANARLHVAASENIERSMALDAIVAPDISAIIDAIKSIGVAAGVPVKISDALPGMLPKSQKDIHAVAFAIESSGSFVSMMRTLALFDSMPMASSIEVVDLSRNAPDTASSVHRAPVWHLNLKMQVLTTTAVSS